MRKPVVSRLMNVTDIECLVTDINTGCMYILSYSLARHFKDDLKAELAFRKYMFPCAEGGYTVNRELGLKFNHIIRIEKTVHMYAMTEQEFINAAHTMPERNTENVNAIYKNASQITLSNLNMKEVKANEIN